MATTWNPRGSGQSEDDWTDSYTNWQAAEQAAKDAQNAAQKAYQNAQTTVSALSDWAGTLQAVALGTEARQHHLADLAADLATTDTDIADTAAAIEDREQARDVATARLLAGPAITVPITLLPISMHTSWTNTTLRVRLYPDQVSLTHHHPELTKAEIAAGETHLATVETGNRAQAWVDLVRQVGAPRAAWVVQQAGSTQAQPAREGSWTDVQVRTGLPPDRFAVVAYAGGQPINVAQAGAVPRYVTWGAAITEGSLTLQPWRGADSPDWTTDFPMAIAAGMAVSIDVQPGSPGIDALVAVGIRTGDGDLADLLTEHAYATGLEILPAGASTNNTDQSRSAFSPQHDADVAADLIGPAPAITENAAGSRLATALGIGRDRIAAVTGAAIDIDRIGQSVGLVVQLATTGPLVTAAGASADDLRPLLAPAGWTPVLRVGQQPYAVLPATAPADWQPLPTEVGAAALPLLQQWASRHQDAIDTDPANPPPAAPAARHATPQDETELLDLLGESNTSLAWSNDTSSFAGVDGLIGPEDGAGSAATYLAALSATAPADLGAVQLPATLLALIATAAKQQAGPEELDAVNAALTAMSGAASTDGGRAELALAVTGHLDAISHRVDPWISALVTERLTAQRAAAHGQTPVVGAYGYLANVAPGKSARTSGHILAPSLGQAATAAVLRAGYLGQRLAAEQALAGSGTVDDADLTLAVDLSSRRVRAARWVLAAVRDGQPLAAVLGYQFERDLTNAHLSRHLPAFRKLTRFQSGSALEKLEEPRRQAQQARDAAAARLVTLQQAAGRAQDAVNAATQALTTQQAMQATIHRLAGPTLQWQSELDTINNATHAAPPPPGSIADLLNKIAEHNAAEPIAVENDRNFTDPAGKPHAVTIVSPILKAAATNWANAGAALNRQLVETRTRATQLTVILGTAASQTILADVGRADQAVRDAQTAVGGAQNAATAAVSAATQYQFTELAGAQATLDAATAAVANMLGQLLSQATTSTALTATVDGLALRGRYRSGRASRPAVWDMATIPFGPAASVDPQITLPGPTDPDFPALLAVLDALDDLVDAIADLITAEGVHHLVNGNPSRSGAALDIAASGTVPDELDVIRTPLTGYDIAHRVLLLAPGGTPALWSGTVTGAADTADPELASWVSTMLPDPATVHLTANRIDPTTGTAGPALELTADAIGGGPLDWLRMAAAPGEITSRIARVARDSWRATLGADADTGRILLGPPLSPDPAVIGLTDLIDAAAAVRGMLVTARAIAPADLATAGAEPPDEPTVDAVARVGASAQIVAKIIADVEAAGQTPAPTTDALLDVLLAAASLGIAEAVPAIDQGTPNTSALQLQAQATVARLTARIGGAEPTTLTQARTRAAELCGFSLPLLTAVATPADPLIAGDLGAGAIRIPGATPSSLRHWLHDHAPVRPACEALLSAYDIAQSLSLPGQLALRAAHLPATGDASGDPHRWAGDSDTPPPAVINVVAVRTGTADLGATVTGLALDSWTQTISDPVIHAGLALNYDRPTSTPPQALLVAVAPDTRDGRTPGSWDLNTLLDIVTSTMALATDRAVAAELNPDAAITVTVT